MNIITIAGSPSAQSRSSRLLAEATRWLHEDGISTTAISVRDLPAEDLLFANTKSPALQAAAKLVEAASGIIVATPVYKAAYSGVLKAFLDILPQYGFAGKVVLPIVTGGSPAHMLTMDYALKPVLSALGARFVLNGVYATDSQVRTRDDGSLDLDDEIVLRLEDGLQRFSDSLEWSAHLEAGSTLPAATGQLTSLRC